MAIDTDRPRTNIILGEEEERAIMENISVEEARQRIEAERAPMPRVEPDEPEPEPRRNIIPRVRQNIPGDAVVVERHASGRPDVYEKDGVRYYTPDSTMFKKGFHNSEEVKKARGADFGPHDGKLVPEQTIAYMSGGKIVGRYSPEKLAKQPKDFPEVPKTKTGQVITVRGKGGRTVILSNKDVERYNKAQGEEKRRLAVELNLIQGKPPAYPIVKRETKKGTTWYTGQKDKREIVASSVPDDVLAMLETGSINRRTAQDFFFTRAVRQKAIHNRMNLAELTNPHILVDNYETTARMTKPGKTDIAAMERTNEMVFALTFGATPFLGTALYWEQMSPGWRAVSIGADILAVTPLPTKAFGFLRGLNKLPGVKAADDAVRAMRQGTKESLRKLTNREVVAAYDGMVKAGDKYGRNLADIEATKKIINTRPGGAKPEDKWALESLQEATDGLKKDLMRKGNELSRKFRESAVFGKYKAIGGDVSGFADDMGRKYADDIATTVQQAFNPPKTTAQLRKSINKTLGRLRDAQQYGDSKTYNKELLKLTELKAEARLHLAGKARDLYNQRLVNADRIAQINREISVARAEIRMGDSSNRVPMQQLIEKLNRELAALQKARPKLDRLANRAAQELAIDYAPQGGSKAGGMGIMLAPPKTDTVITRSGGGVRTKGSTTVLPSISYTAGKISEIPKQGEDKPGTKTTTTPELIPSIPGKQIPGTRKKGKEKEELLPNLVTPPGSKPSPGETIKETPSYEETPTPEEEPTPEPEDTPKKTPPKSPPTTDTPPNVPPRALVRYLPGAGGTDRERRRMIASAKGAIAWRQGELHGKDRWDVIVSPYTKDENYTIVLGRKPRGAIITKGPGSAYRSARLIYGQRINRPTAVNQPGLFATKLYPTAGKSIKLQFTRDIELSKKIGSLEKRGRVFPLT